MDSCTLQQLLTYIAGMLLAGMYSIVLMQKIRLAVFKMAIDKHGKPDIINSDQGSQFTCALWTEFVDEETKIKISMDGRGRATDNIFIERFWRTLKQDYVYLHPAESGTELYKGLRGYIIYYNNQKSHQGIGRITPAKLYHQAA